MIVVTWISVIGHGSRLNKSKGLAEQQGMNPRVSDAKVLMFEAAER